MLLSNQTIYFDIKNKTLTSEKNKNTIKTDIALTEDLVIPDEVNGIPVEYLDSDSFTNLKFKKIKLGNNLKEISDYCFANSILTELSIPKSVNYLGVSCFYDSPLEKLTFESDSKLKTLNNYCFYSTQLTELTIPKSVNYLGEGVFYEAPLKKLIFEKDSELKLIKYHCFSCSNLKELVLPKSVLKIEDYCFHYSPLERIIFESESNLQIIGRSCFSYSRLRNITIPKSIKNLGTSCFFNSPLISISFGNKDIKMDFGCFYRANLKQKPNIPQKNLKEVFNNSPFLYHLADNTRDFSRVD